MMFESPALQPIVCSPASVIPSPKICMRLPSIGLVFTIAATVFVSPSHAADAPKKITKSVDADSVGAYVRSCLKPNGAFGPVDQEYTDAAWNYPAVLTLSLMGEGVENQQAILKS